jgi:hypothetical protein
MDFAPKRVSEEIIYGVDFARFIKNRPGVTIVSATWSNSVAYGADANPAAMIRGQAAIVGSVVSTWIVGGVAGVGYYPLCQAVLSNGETPELPDPDEGLLIIKP